MNMGLKNQRLGLCSSVPGLALKGVPRNDGGVFRHPVEETPKSTLSEPARCRFYEAVEIDGLKSTRSDVTCQVS